MWTTEKSKNDLVESPQGTLRKFAGESRQGFTRELRGMKRLPRDLQRSEGESLES